MIISQDQLGQQHQLPAPPRRILSLVPSQSELLIDLGLHRELVGITQYCIHPEWLPKQSTVVGGTKNFSISKIAALRPDLILANKEENPRERTEELRAFCPVWVSDVQTPTDGLDLIARIGHLTNTADRADTLRKGVQQSLETLHQTAPALRTTYLIWKKPLMTVGGDTYISAMLQHIGLNNVWSGSTRYPEITPEDIRNSGTELLLLSSEPYSFQPADEIAFRYQFPGVRIARADGAAFSWYGSRILHITGELLDFSRLLAEFAREGN